ncbi:hypothetical protein B9K06_04165 [Bacillus sp. OG2]|nr:hypothetical protein B9K06_04165 [Bacillus sp. OG2]
MLSYGQKEKNRRKIQLAAIKFKGITLGRLFSKELSFFIIIQLQKITSYIPFNQKRHFIYLKFYSQHAKQLHSRLNKQFPSIIRNKM